MKSYQLLFASALCGVTAIALATSPCGWPVTAKFNSGGQCVNPPHGDPYCTQPSLESDGGCLGQGNPNQCHEVFGVYLAPHYVLRSPTGGCQVKYPCVEELYVTTNIPFTNGLHRSAPCEQN